MNGWEAVSLNRSRCLITRQLDVLEHSRVQASVLKSLNGLDPDGAFLDQLNLGNTGISLTV